jgi:hypothetical protein
MSFGNLRCLKNCWNLGQSRAFGQPRCVISERTHDVHFPNFLIKFLCLLGPIRLVEKAICSAVRLALEFSLFAFGQLLWVENRPSDPSEGRMLAGDLICETVAAIAPVWPPTDSLRGLDDSVVSHISDDTCCHVQSPGRHMSIVK